MPPTLSRAYLAQTRRMFRCQCKVKIPFSCGESLIDRCFDLLEEIDARYNSYQPGSFFHHINERAGQWVEVDDHCICMLQTLKRISSITRGGFDITCMPLIRLWGFYRSSNQDIPTAEALRDILKRVDYRTVSIEGNRVKIEAGQEIITGSFLKAFAVDQAMRFLRSEGVTDAVINAGGSTIIALNDETHPAWKVNIPDPFIPGIFSDRTTIRNQCFSLSGRTNNHVVIKNKTYGHILDSRTGFPASTVQVGVITREAFLGDAISTALFTLAEDEFDEVARELKRHFDFEYFRTEETGERRSSACF